MAPLAGPDEFFAATKANLGSNNFKSKYSKKPITKTGPTSNDSVNANGAQASNTHTASANTNNFNANAAAPSMSAEPEPSNGSKNTSTETSGSTTAEEKFARQLTALDDKDKSNGSSMKDSVTGTERMNLMTAIHALQHAVSQEFKGLEHAVIQPVKDLCSQVEAMLLKQVHADTGSTTTTTSRGGNNAVANSNSVAAPKSQPAATEATIKLEAPAPPGSRSHLPRYIRDLAPYTSAALATSPLPSTIAPLTFTHSFLTATLGGTEYSPCLYYPATNLTALLTEPSNERIHRLKHPKKALPRTEKHTYYLFDASTNPYVPREGGQHGASVGLFFREFEHPDHDGEYVDVPCFVALPEHNAHMHTIANGVDKNGAGAVTPSAAKPNGSNGEQKKELVYTYMGQYSQTRYSDRISYCATSSIIPTTTQNHWTNLVTSPLRPDWLTKALSEHLYPLPEYEGTVPAAEDALNDDIKADIAHFFQLCRERDEDANAAVRGLDAKQVSDLLERAESDMPPVALRWWWEYLQCVGFDRGFVYALATLQKGGSLDANAKAVRFETDGDGITRGDFGGNDVEGEGDGL